MYKAFVKPPGYKSVATSETIKTKESIAPEEKKEPVPEKKKEKQSLMFRYNWFAD